MKRKIVIVIGTKAEIIKVAPLMLELEKQKKGYWFIHTGQHLFENEFGVKEPDFVLSQREFKSGINRGSISWCFQMLFKIRKLIRELKPKYVVFHGDTMGSAIASISTSKLLNPTKEWKNIHLEAGLRSGSLFEPFPEEISRRICDKFADTLLVVSELSEKNVSKYRKSKEIINVGNTGIDASLMAYENIKKEMKQRK